MAVERERKKEVVDGVEYFTVYCGIIKRNVIF